MANRVDIDIRANADTAGIKKTDRALDELKHSADGAVKSGKDLKTAFSASFLGNLGAQVAQRAGAELLDMGLGAVNLADQLADLAGKADVSATSLQRIGNAAADNGSSLSATADAMAKLAINAQAAIDGDNRLIEAFKRLKIGVGELSTIAPDELFLRIADAMSTAENKGRSFDAANDVIGRSAKDLRKTLNLGRKEIVKLGEEFGVFSSDELVAELDDAKKAIDRFKKESTVGIGEIIGSMLEFRDDTRQTVDDLENQGGRAGDVFKILAAGFRDTLNKSTKEGAGRFKELRQEVDGAAGALGKFVKAGGEFKAVIKDVEEGSDDVTDSFDDEKAAVDSVTDAIEEQRVKLLELDAARKKLSEKQGEFIDITSESIGGVKTSQKFRKEDIGTSIGGQLTPNAGATAISGDDVQALKTLQATVKEKEGAVADAAQGLQTAISETSPAIKTALTDSGLKLGEISGHVESFKATVDEHMGETATKATEANESLTKYGEAVSKGFEDVSSFATTTAGAIAELTRRLAVAESNIAKNR